MYTHDHILFVEYYDLSEKIYLLKRDNLYQKYEYGGLKLTNIENLINAAGWTKRNLDKNN